MSKHRERAFHDRLALCRNCFSEHEIVVFETKAERRQETEANNPAELFWLCQPDGQKRLRGIPEGRLCSGKVVGRSGRLLAAGLRRVSPWPHTEAQAGLTDLWVSTDSEVFLLGAASDKPEWRGTLSSKAWLYAGRQEHFNQILKPREQTYKFY